MTTDELSILIQSLQDEIKQGQEIQIELRIDIENHSKQEKALKDDNDYLRQNLASMKVDNSNYHETRARLETQLYAQEQDLSNQRKEIQQLSKTKKDIEKKLAAELQVYENDKSIWQQREADFYNQIKSLSLNNMGEPRTLRANRRRSVTASTVGIMSPFTSGLVDIGENPADTTLHVDNDIKPLAADDRPSPKLAVIDSSYARETKIAQRTIRAQDKMIFDLKNQVEKLKLVIQEKENESQTQSFHASHLQHEIDSVKEVNRGLMEENESYQILLHEKTITGEFMMNPIMQVHENPAMKESISTSSNSQGLNLAAELASSIPDWNNQKENGTIQKLNEENKTLQDTNRALQLYMNKILMKIINNKQLEDVLSIDQPSKPTSPQSSDAAKRLAEGGAGGSAGANSGRGVGPAPTKTVSTAAFATNKETPKLVTPTNRQRRRTISYWGAKTIGLPSPPSKFAAHQETDGLEDTAEDKRRHSSIVPNASPQPERSLSTTTSSNSANGGWAKALRRMSGIGWASVKEEPDVTVVVSNDSAVGSLSEDENAETTSRKSSGSSTPSIRRSNELGTLSEE